MYSEIISRWKEGNPMGCHVLGIHDYDGRLPDLSPEFLERRINEIQSDLQQLDSMDTPQGRFDLFEFELIKSALNEELFELDVRQEFKENPAIFIFPLAMIEMSYTARTFAPVEDRVNYIVQIEKNIPLYLEQADNLLNDSLPASKIGMAIQFLSGIINYFRDRLITFVTQIDNEDLIDEWSEANIMAVESMEKFLQKLQTTYMPVAHNNFALGKEKFMELLAKTEDVHIDYETLLRVGEEDLERNYQAMQQIADELTEGDISKLMELVKKDIPTPDTLISTAEGTLERTRQFLIDSKIVSLPTDKQTKIIHTPEFARSFGFAAMSTPGPFESKDASESYYWITPPDINWPQERQQKFLEFFNKAFLEIVTIHEVWPGHYLQLLYNNQAKSDVAKMFSRSTAMIEGWGHYVEEMIYEAGYEPFDRRILHVGQLLGALARNVRYISALRMHCEDMTIEESKQMFIEKGLLGEDNATIEANRGTIDPMYLNYTLGKLMIKKLRSDIMAEKGDKFNLKEFHDTLLSYGSPPISVLRKLILENPAGNII
ncbi:MAG: DUF885 domain-containing protein [Candidatus Heimdallarchaeota archaeon]|nr:DUF885 domain-containing protein [Candidatus Heimdallarchaeota archaeon]